MKSFLHRVAISLMIFCVLALSVLGLLYFARWTQGWAVEHLTFFYDPFVVHLYCVLGVLVTLFVLITSPGRLGRHDAVLINEEGGSTLVLQTAINKFLRAVLREIDGVNNTDTQIATHHGGALTVEITANVSGVKSRPELVKEIRDTARRTLTKTLGIPNVENINVRVEEFRYIKENEGGSRALMPVKKAKEEQDSSGDISLSQSGYASEEDKDDDDAINISAYDVTVEKDAGEESAPKTKFGPQ
ncbi:alkaline shock response membrane anchor protein AmaP [Candidatus Sumerlaeota bacterium]|nr:alkaline shock response membrane anchor protein AmaP [Candidatus Sumerlaeota bacterium]